MRRFLRKSSVQREPLAVTMTGVRMGERVLQIGLADRQLTAMLVSRPGLSGQAAIAVADAAAAEKARAAATESGALVDVHVAPLEALPIADGAFDVVIVHNAAATLTARDAAARVRAMAECLRVLRAGGRLIALEPGTPSGVAALLRRTPVVDTAYESAGGTVSVLEAAGFKPVRLLADRDGIRFIEGLRTSQ
jgi:SAM-dependent methyltransferase